MSTRADSFERLNTLIAALRERRLNEQEGIELQELLRTLPGAYRHLSEHFVMTSLLEEELKVMSDEMPVREERYVLSWFRQWRWSFGAAMAAVAVIAGVLFYSRPGPTEQHSSLAQSAPKLVLGEQLDDGVALLTETFGAEADQEGAPVRIGTSLRPGRLRLPAGGVVRIEFYSGATIILEGAADLNIKSANEATLLSGKLLANVPPHARGFTIRSPELELVDQGTEFGISVNKQDGTRVHVLTGRVDIFDPDSNRSDKSKKEMLAGAGLHVDPNGMESEMPADLGSFVSPESLRTRISANLQERGLQWQRFRDQMQLDPRVIAYYPFERDSSNDRALRNIGGKEVEMLTGSIVGATWADGRWPGKKALEFKRPGDRVRISIPGRYQSVTLLAWVRIDGLDNRYNSLMLSDGWGRAGAMHWEFLTGGELELSVCSHSTLDYDFRTSQKMLRAYDLGRWIQLAVVYDGTEGLATHYIDGAPVQTLKLEEALPIEIGPAHIGNWSPSGFQDATPIRNFNGRMDELILFGAALSAREIASFYQSGQPQL